MVCNRETFTENGKEKFKNKGKEHALPKFRVAECQVTGEDKPVEYQILENQYPPNYMDVVEALKKDSKENNFAGTSRMFFDLYSQMFNDKNKQSDVLVFIHGFANSFDDNLIHINSLYNTFIKRNDCPVKHLVYIAWPTRNHKILTYWDDQKDARETGRVLARVYEKLIDFFIEMFKVNRMKNCESKIHLAAHSMGNQVLKSMLQNINGKIYPLLGEVLLLHSDVENTVFEEGEPFTKLEKLAERTHIYIHRSDDALFISRFSKNFNKRLGKKGPVNPDRLNNETFIVDVSRLRSGESFRERLFDHWGYKESKFQVNDIIEVLKGEDAEEIANRKKINDKLFHLIEPPKDKKQG